MTTAQERRRARRIARRAAPERGLPAVAPEVVVETPAPPSPAPAPRPVPLPAPVVADHRPGPQPVSRSGMQHWVAVRSTRHEVAPPAAERAAGRPTNRWVAVKARTVSDDGVETEAPRPEPKVQESLEALPREPRDDTHAAVDDDGPAPLVARALHPRSRAIRITRVKTNGKRRWSVDFLVRAPDMHLPQ